MDDSPLRAIPNVFYDIIVFVAPSLIATIGLVFGIKGDQTFAEAKIPDLGAINLVLILVLGLIGSYEIGRMAEALSALTVQRPLRWIGKHVSIFRNPDFLGSHPDIYGYLGLDAPPDGRRGDKWVIYFFASSVNPELGGDLLKRYAWEKLARSSALVYSYLFLASFAIGLLRQAGAIGSMGPALGFGSAAYTVGFGVMTALTYSEYYKRNCWNFDLMETTLPVFVTARADVLGRSDSST